MKVAYADPPYPGCAHLYRGHEDYNGEVDHGELIERMSREYEGWILHTGSVQLKEVLALCPDDVRLLSWVKGWASFKPGASIKYAWEPVILWNPRQRVTGSGQPFVRDWLMCNVGRNRQGALVQDFTGGKPRLVCEWVFDCMGLEGDDELGRSFPRNRRGLRSVGYMALSDEACRMKALYTDDGPPSSPRSPVDSDSGER